MPQGSCEQPRHSAKHTDGTDGMHAVKIYTVPRVAGEADHLACVARYGPFYWCSRSSFPMVPRH